MLLVPFFSHPLLGARYVNQEAILDTPAPAGATERTIQTYCLSEVVPALQSFRPPQVRPQILSNKDELLLIIPCRPS